MCHVRSEAPSSLRMAGIYVANTEQDSWQLHGLLYLPQHGAALITVLDTLSKD
jgi:hypothetical protein